MKTKILAAAFVLAAPAVALADIDYGYLEIDHNMVSMEGDVDADGFGIRGSLPFNDSWYGVASTGTVTTDPGEADITGTSLGIGWHTEVANQVDFLAELTYEAVDVEGTDGDNGYGLKAGVRGMMADSFELNGHVRRVDMTEADTLLGVGAVWTFTGSWSLTAGFESGDADTMSIGLRYGF